MWAAADGKEGVPSPAAHSCAYTEWVGITQGGVVLHRAGIPGSVLRRTTE